jgi:uncharacterized repeat protein (TIGR04138 family)
MALVWLHHYNEAITGTDAIDLATFLQGYVQFIQDEYGCMGSYLLKEWNIQSFEDLEHICREFVARGIFSAKAFNLGWNRPDLDLHQMLQRPYLTEKASPVTT